MELKMDPEQNKKKTYNFKEYLDDVSVEEFSKYLDNMSFVADSLNSETMSDDLYKSYVPKKTMDEAKNIIATSWKGDFKIIKSSHGNKILTKQAIIELTSKMISNVVMKQKPALKLFTPTLESEVEESLKKIFDNWGIVDTIDKKTIEQEFDDAAKAEADFNEVQL
jgi:hypothetical protein